MYRKKGVCVYVRQERENVCVNKCMYEGEREKAI